MLKHVGDKWYVLDSSGKKVLGKHKSRKKAVAQLQAIEISKSQKNESKINYGGILQEQIMTLEYHDQLNPDFWENEKLKEEVREKLIQIGHAWAEWAKIPVHAIKDYLFVGGNANYNYTDNSDVDLHLLVDTNEIADCPDFVEEYFEDKKDLWSLKHNITLYGHKVEIYAQDVDAESPKDQGVYSVLTDEWIEKPVNKNLDLKSVPGTEKVSEFKNEIDSLLLQNADDEDLQALKDQIKNIRRDSIQKYGEFGIGNLIFKELRNLGYFEKMNQAIRSRKDDRLSL
jgi:hypothetical protein